MCERDPRGSLEAGAGRARWKPRRRPRPGRAGSGGNAQAPPGAVTVRCPNAAARGRRYPRRTRRRSRSGLAGSAESSAQPLAGGGLGRGVGAARVAVVGGAAAARQPISSNRRRAAMERGPVRKRCGTGAGITAITGGHRGREREPGRTGAGARRDGAEALRSAAGGAGGRCRRDGRGSEALGPWPRRAADGPAVPSEVLANEAVSCLNRAMAALRDIWEEIGIPEEQRLERTDVVRKHIKVRGAGSSVGPRTCCMQRPPATRAARREPTQRRCRGSSTGPGLRGAPGVPARLLPRLCPRPVQPRPAGLPTPRSGPARVPRGGPAALPALGSHAPPLTAPVCRASWT